jgi:hypothetical protein
MSKLDLAPSDNMIWNTAPEFYEKLTMLDSSALLCQSQKVLEHFKNNHDLDIVKSYFLQEKGFCNIPEVVCTDDVLHDIFTCRYLFNCGGETKDGGDKADYGRSEVECRRDDAMQLLQAEYNVLKEEYNKIVSLKSHIKHYIRKKVSRFARSNNYK